ncbi:MAG: hypothetical protein ACRD1L_05330 [Terriglobales bacterium]
MKASQPLRMPVRREPPAVKLGRSVGESLGHCAMLLREGRTPEGRWRNLRALMKLAVGAGFALGVARGLTLTRHRRVRNRRDWRARWW